MAIVGALPVQLANGTLADANQVMADFNSIVTDVNANAAALAGGNAFTGAQTIAGDTITTNTATQTLTNKTLTTPVIAFGAGSAAAPSVTNATGNTGAYWPTTTSLGIATAGVNAVTVDASQNVGIGGAPATRLMVYGATTGVAVQIGDIAAVPTSNDNCHVGTSSVALDGRNGDLILAPRTSGGNQIQFYTGSGASVKRLSIDAAGVVSFTGAVSGITTLSASGLATLSAGLTFDGVSTLSNFIITTAITPAMTLGGGSTGMTFGTQTGRATQIGDWVIFSLRVRLTAKGSSTGAVLITGLPTTARAVDNTAVSVTCNNWGGGAGTVPCAVVLGGSKTIAIEALTQATGATAQVTDPSITNTSDFIISGTYPV